MSKKRILYISQEISPYLPSSPMGTMGRVLPQGTQEKGKEIRIFMPRYGCINERRHQLHEVIRLSGMNIIIDDQDHPLIIKVASIQPARTQVYFIDNEEYFQRKAVLAKKDGGKFFDDNDERSIFFCRGVLETVRKLGWNPDIVHCSGWMTSLIPLYLKTVYADDPIFADSKVVYSAWDDPYKGELNVEFGRKAVFDNVQLSDVEELNGATIDGVNAFAMKHADGVILGTQDQGPLSTAQFDDLSGPKLTYQSEDEYLEVYSEFYDEILDSVLAE